MCEGLVGVCHLVGILALLDGCAEVVAGIHDLACETLLHCLLAALAGVADQPAKAESLTTCGSYFDRNLVSCTADTASLDFEAGHDVVHSFGEGVNGLLAGLLLDDVKSVLNDLLSNTLFAVQHDSVDELGHQNTIVHRIG